MTTEVTIKMTTPHNGKDIMVDVFNGEGEITDSHRVSDEQEVSLFVYDTQALGVREVEKEVSEETTQAEGQEAGNAAGEPEEPASAEA